MAKRRKTTANQSTRPPIERMLKIHNLIKGGSHPNATRLAGELEVTTKTIYRDIAFMRERLDLPVEFEPAYNGYHYLGEVGQFPTVKITEGELFAMMVAEKAMQQYRGTNFENPLLSAFRKVTEGLTDTISFNLDDFDSSISFRTSAEPVLNLEVIDALHFGVGNPYLVVKASIDRDMDVASEGQRGNATAIFLRVSEPINIGSTTTERDAHGRSRDYHRPRGVSIRLQADGAPFEP